MPGNPVNPTNDKLGKPLWKVDKLGVDDIETCYKTIYQVNNAILDEDFGYPILSEHHWSQEDFEQFLTESNIKCYGIYLLRHLGRTNFYDAGYIKEPHGFLIFENINNNDVSKVEILAIEAFEKNPEVYKQLLTFFGKYLEKLTKKPNEVVFEIRETRKDHLEAMKENKYRFVKMHQSRNGDVDHFIYKK